MHVSVLGAFDFAAADGSRRVLAAGAQRLLAFLALREGPVLRRAAARSLWPEASEDRASSSLRTALSRLDEGARDAVAIDGGSLRLAPDVTVDYRDSQAIARHLLDDDGSIDVGPGAIAALTRDLLPDWYDEWVVPDAEQWRQRRVAALEALSNRFTSAGRLPHAMLAAVAAVHVDPLRERATEAVMRVHLAEGNPGGALCELRRYRALVQRELGAEPSDALYELVGVPPAATRRRGDGHPPAAKWDEIRRAREKVIDLQRRA